MSYYGTNNKEIEELKKIIYDLEVRMYQVEDRLKEKIDNIN